MFNVYWAGAFLGRPFGFFGPPGRYVLPRWPIHDLFSEDSFQADPGQGLQSGSETRLLIAGSGHDPVAWVK